MAQYPNDKGAQSSWLSPAAQTPYASRDGAPGEYHAPPGPPPPAHDAPAYYPPGGPPPDYTYARTHPPDGSAHDAKNAQETYLSPPVRASSPYHVWSAEPTTTTPSSSSPAPGPSGPTAQSGLMMSLGNFFGNKGPPPMWSRAPPPANVLAYGAFPPMCLISNDASLGNGFPELPPPCAMNPHPFATHDIMEEDWKRFLADVKKAAGLSPAQRIRSNVIPMVTGMSFITGFIATNLIEKKMKHKNRQAAGDVVDHWNHYFFGPRGMEVVLCQASERLSGRIGAAPVGDAHQTRMAQGLRRRDDSSSSDSSEDDRSRGGHDREQHGFRSDKHARRAARRERRSERRAEKRERRAERRERKARGEDREPYQLFVTSV